jgi:hypothetical protein
MINETYDILTKIDIHMVYKYKKLANIVGEPCYFPDFRNEKKS